MLKIVIPPSHRLHPFGGIPCHVRRYLNALNFIRELRNLVWNRNVHVIVN